MQTFGAHVRSTGKSLDLSGAVPKRLTIEGHKLVFSFFPVDQTTDTINVELEIEGVEPNVGPVGAGRFFNNDRDVGVRGGVEFGHFNPVFGLQKIWQKPSRQQTDSSP